MDNTPLAVRKHLAKNSESWWKTDQHFGFKVR